MVLRSLKSKTTSTASLRSIPCHKEPPPTEKESQPTSSAGPAVDVDAVASATSKQGGWRASRLRWRTGSDPGVDPLNLWGNARGGSSVPTDLQPRAPSTPRLARANDGIRLDDVNHAYRDRHNAPIQALAGVSLHADHGELLAVVGPSGCGKTTLLELICGLQAPDAGWVECAPAALMPQRDLLLPWLSAVDNAALALRIAHRPRAEARTQAAKLFAELGLKGFEQAHPHELSGG